MLTILGVVREIIRYINKSNTVDVVQMFMLGGKGRRGGGGREGEGGKGGRKGGEGTWSVVLDK